MDRHRIRAVAICTLVLLVAAPIAQAVVTPTRVLGGSAWQYNAFADDVWLTYTENANNRALATAMRRATERTFRLNEAGTNGFTGGIDPGTDVAIYQQHDGDRSAIYLYDLGDRGRRLAPGVNSPAWEWQPRISNRFISFMRDRVTNGVAYVDLMLHHRDAGTTRTIATFKRARYTVEGLLFLENVSVGDRYVSWGACTRPDVACDSFVYDAVERTTKKITGGGDKQEYAAVVEERDGVVYFTRSGNGCGVNVAIWRLPLDHLAATPTKVAALPSGYDTDYLASVAENDVTGEIDYYFTRGSCQRWNADVYVAEGVDAA